MDHAEARLLLLDRRRGVLGDDVTAQLDAHLAECAACRHEDAAERQLSVLLEQRLPRADAPESLKRALEARWVVPAPRRRAAFFARSSAIMALGAALAVAAIFGWRARTPDDALVAEAVNDHLRVLYSEHPLDVESGGIHRVKPWFEGRLDFAPVVDFAGDDDFPLMGGAVAYFVDRKAATFVFKRRLHEITLFVFRSEGLRWPVAGPIAVGPDRAALQTFRGFHVVLWRHGDLGYALVSDTNEDDLRVLAAKIAGP
jgi:anti-sigma factor RsiW